MKTTVAFICTGNSCRSQMAEGWARYLAPDLLTVYSAGTHPSSAVHPQAIASMREVGVDISEHRPKLLEKIPASVDIVITMGCGVVCPTLPCRHREDWGLEDPANLPPEEFARIRDEIKSRVMDLIQHLP